MYIIDETDRQILELLKIDGRMSYSDIAEKVHLSRVAVRDRIVNMMNNKVIMCFTVQINAKAYNKDVSAFFDIEVDPMKLESIAKQLADNEEIAIISQHTGTTGLHVHAFIDCMENLSQFMNENFYSIKGVKSVHSYVLIKNYKTNPYLR